MTTAATVPLNERQSDLSVRIRPRWKWTLAGLLIGTALTLIGVFQHSFEGVIFELVGFVLLFATLLSFWLVGPAPE